MNPDKTAIEKLWEKHSQQYFSNPHGMMDKDGFLAALSEAEGEPASTEQLPNGEKRERWAYWSSRYAELEKRYNDYRCRWWRCQQERDILFGVCGPYSDEAAKKLDAIVFTTDSEILALIDSPKAAGEEKKLAASEQLAEGFRLERNIMQEIAMRAREAGRREGFNEGLLAIKKYAGAVLNVHSSHMTPNQREGYHWVIEKSVALLELQSEVERLRKESK